MDAARFWPCHARLFIRWSLPFCGHLQQINFDGVLREARAIRAGEPVEKWLAIWNDRYPLKGVLDAIAQRLEREGFPGMEARVQAWRALLAQKPADYYPLARY